MLIELTRRQKLLQDEIRWHADDLRAHAIAVDARPDDLTDQLTAPSVQAVRRVAMSVLYRAPGRCLELVVGLIEAARGDAGVVLACPGPGVAGVVVDKLADAQQRDLFVAALSDQRSWAFCAITEPLVGSDAMRMTSELRPAEAGDFLLSGTKRYVGNAHRGSIGVVFARTGPSPLAIRAVLVRVPAPGIRSTVLHTLGLRGAQIGELRFDDVRIPAEHLLGRHLSATRRGIWGAVEAFDTVRVQVAAMALGTALAVHDYVVAQGGPTHRASATGSVSNTGPAGRRLEAFRGRIDATRQLVYRAADQIDNSHGRGHLSSLAKYEAVELARAATRTLPALLGPGALLAHPLLEKWRRDADGFEFMEGTSTIQKLNIAEGRLRAAGGGGR